MGGGYRKGRRPISIKANSVCAAEALIMCRWNLKFGGFFLLLFYLPIYSECGDKKFGRSQILGDQTFGRGTFGLFQQRITAAPAALVLKDRTGLERPVAAREEKTSRQGEPRRRQLGFSVGGRAHRASQRVREVR